MAYVSNTLLVTATNDPGISQLKSLISGSSSPWTSGMELRSCDSVRPGTGWYGGSKLLTVDVFPAAFNYLDLEELTTMIEAVSWDSPECVQLLLMEESQMRFRDVDLALGGKRR